MLHKYEKQANVLSILVPFLELFPDLLSLVCILYIVLVNKPLCRCFVVSSHLCTLLCPVSVFDQLMIIENGSISCSLQNQPETLFLPSVINNITSFIYIFSLFLRCFKISANYFDTVTIFCNAFHKLNNFVQLSVSDLF